MKNWKTVELPELMKDLPLDKRGLPIPIIILKDKEGNYHFKINDTTIVEKCIADKLCSVCGKPMINDMWLIGGPLSAFHPNGVFGDSPVHKSCGEYALQVCPYLAVSTYNGKLNRELESGVFDGMAFVNITQTQDRVPFFVFCRISGYNVSRRSIERYIVPVKPYLDVEFWNDGEKITKEQAQKLLDNG